MPTWADFPGRFVCQSSPYVPTGWMAERDNWHRSGRLTHTTLRYRFVISNQRQTNILTAGTSAGVAHIRPV